MTRETSWSQSRLESLERIYAFLDGEANDDAILAIKQHLQCCPECEREYKIEALMKELVRRSCCQDQAPQDLADKIRARITVERTRITYHRE